MDYDAYDALLHHIFKQTQGDAWFKPQVDNISCGVCIRVQPGAFRVFPYENVLLEPFHTAVVALNPEVAVKLRSASIHAVFGLLSDSQSHLFIDDDTRIQVLDTMEELATAEKDQRAAFIRDERVLVVWEDRVTDIIPSCADFEERLVKLVWRERIHLPSSNLNGSFNGSPGSASATRLSPSASGSQTRLPQSNSQSGLPLPPPILTNSRYSSSRSPFSPTYGNIPAPDEKLLQWQVSDIEKSSTISGNGALVPSTTRTTRIYANIYIGLAMALATVFVGNGVNVLIREFILDGTFMRFILLVTSPLIFCVSLFFALQIINSVSFVAARTNEDGEIAACHDPNARVQGELRKGHLVDEEEREARLKLYADNNIGWVARPKHSDEPNGFKRAGRFKVEFLPRHILTFSHPYLQKASNMNFGLALSRRMEEIIETLESNPNAFPECARTSGVPDPANPYRPPHHDSIEERALSIAVSETNGEAWASCARSLRLGEIILLVDSDTQVPDDCFRDAARELEQCPEVAIIQHESDVMQVANHWFENGMAYFTRRINHCISAATANGEVAPFVGHNAFLRWSAIQDAAFTDSLDGKTKFWSEAHVSEDFDMSLRLQLKGYIIRWANYSAGGFKEGVSLTCDDELNRWMKYAYGCNEYVDGNNVDNINWELNDTFRLLFNPIHQWPFKSPVTKRMRDFVWSAVPLHYKITVLSYGIAAAFTLTLLNYLLLGFAFPVDGFYMRSWEMWLAITVVFVGAGNVGITILDYRLYGKDLIHALWSNIKWVPFL
ncbi:hypothetical protein Clacol_000262 [Clathrus columnatus]|uniref:Glycosyltransferase 2-like domain-containing protein n=1 Tax=Clathrus columnatus TaxID=1419009 RepID=A0AAV5A092_9AGAM|nr:hypothetical protein Clacol_000262 [Clathrus columnatus]